MVQSNDSREKRTKNSMNIKPSENTVENPRMAIQLDKDQPGPRSHRGWNIFTLPKTAREGKIHQTTALGEIFTLKLSLAKCYSLPQVTMWLLWILQFCTSCSHLSMHDKRWPRKGGVTHSPHSLPHFTPLLLYSALSSSAALPVIDTVLNIFLLNPHFCSQQVL